MARRIEEEVSENRRSVRRVESLFRSPATDQSVKLGFLPIELVVDVSGTVDTRPVNDTLVVGGAATAQQVGRGVVGDHRGGWSQAGAATASDGELVEQGRTAFAESMAATTIGLKHVAVGGDDTRPSVADTALGAPGRITDGWGQKTTTDTVTGTGIVRLPDQRDTVAEVGLYDQSERLVARVVSDGIDPGPGDEVRVAIDCAITTDPTGSVAVTDLDTLTDAVAYDRETVGIKEIALGTDDTDPTTSDTALGNEVVRKEAGTEVQGPRLRATASVFRSEPDTSSYEITELGVFDASGTMVWRRTFEPQTKDKRTRLNVTDGLLYQ